MSKKSRQKAQKIEEEPTAIAGIMFLMVIIAIIGVIVWQSKDKTDANNLISNYGINSTSSTNNNTSTYTNSVKTPKSVIIPLGNANINSPSDLQGSSATLNQANTSNLQGNSNNPQNAYPVKPGELDKLNL